jgi:hypothetical protein
LGALQCLDLTLFIHAQDNGLVGGIEVQPHHVGELLGESPVTGELEPLRGYSNLLPRWDCESPRQP